MNVRVFLLSTISTTLLSVSAAHAAASSPVAHNHNGRSHSHSLPTTGKNHTHGGAKKKAPAKLRPSTLTAHDKDNAILVNDGWTPLSKNWYYVSKSSTNLFTVKSGSAATEGAYRTMVMQQHIRLHKEDKNIHVFTNVVKISSADCSRGVGQMRVFKLNGEQKFTADFVKDGNSTGDTLGKHICDMSTIGFVR